MKKILVQMDSEEKLVSTKVDGECQHNGEQSIEDLDYGYADRYKADWVDDIKPTYICDDCDEALDIVELDPDDGNEY